jgi:hypothetical protein
VRRKVGAGKATEGTVEGWGMASYNQSYNRTISPKQAQQPTHASTGRHPAIASFSSSSRVIRDTNSVIIAYQTTI